MGTYHNNAGMNHRRRCRVPSENVVVSAPAFAVVSPLLVGSEETPSRSYGGGSRNDQQRLDNSAAAEPAGHTDYPAIATTTTVLGCGGNEEASIACEGDEGFDEYGNPVPELRAARRTTANKRAAREARTRRGDNGAAGDGNTATMQRDCRGGVSCKAAGFGSGSRNRMGRSRPASGGGDSASQRKRRKLKRTPTLPESARSDLPTPIDHDFSRSLDSIKGSRESRRLSEDGDTTTAAAAAAGIGVHMKQKRANIRSYKKVYDMDGVQTARFCHNRKDAETTYLPTDDALYSLKDGSPRDGRLDLCGWGVMDDDMSAVAKIVLANVDVKADAGGVTSLVLDKCWRLTDEGVEGLALPCLDRACSPNRLEAISLAYCGFLTDKSAFNIYQAFGGLLSIDVSGTGITDDGLQLLLGSGKSLVSLGLRDLPGLTDRGVAAVLQCIKRRRKLQNLKLCRSLRFTDDGLLALLSAGGILRTLDIHGCSQLSELCLMGLERAAYTSTQLRVLDVRGMEIADIGLAWVAQGCKVLESLNISRCPLLTDLALEYLAKGSGEAKPTPLKVLNVAGVTGFTDEGMLTFMPRSGPTLEGLILDGAIKLGDGSVRAIARHCPNLTSLSMVELTRTSDRSLKELGMRCPKLRLLDSSSDMNVLETSHRTRVPKLGGLGILEMSVGTPCLAVLRLNGACKISDEALVAVGANCPLLEELCIRSCSLVTDIGLSAIARGCPRLSHVGASGCIQLTDGSVRAVTIRRGEGIRDLDFSGCRGVTDRSLESMGQHCRGLESVALQGCERITDEGVLALIKGCPNITTLNLRGVNDLTEESVAGVETYCRRLCRLNMDGIPEVSGSRVQVAGERLPLVTRAPGTRQLRPCNLACRVFNAHVQERAEWTAGAIAVQRIIRGKLCRLRWTRGMQEKARAAATLRIKLTAAWVRKLFRNRMRRRRAENAAAKVIQAGAADLFFRRQAQQELGRRRREREAAMNIQRTVRGRLARVATKDKRRRGQRACDNWKWFVKKIFRRNDAFAHWRSFLSLSRCYLKLWRIAHRQRCHRACRKIQRAWRRLLNRREQRRVVMAELERRVVAATVIQKNYRSYFKRKWLMRDIRVKEQLFKRLQFRREYAQIELAFWWKRVRVKHLKRTVLMELAVARKAVGTIKRAYQSYLLRTMAVRAKKKAIAVRCRWRRLYLGIKSMPRPEDAFLIQLVIKRYLRKRKRQKAVTDIQRVFKGFLARRIFVVKLARMYTLNAINIQRVGRGHIARRGEVRAVLEANHAARVITRGLRIYIVNKLFKALVNETRARRAKFARLQREDLVRQRAEAAVRRAFLMNQERAAKSIQMHWRQRKARRQREEAMLLSREMDQRKALEKKQRQKDIDELRKNQSRGRQRVGGALSAFGRKFNKLTAQEDPELASEDHISVGDDDEDDDHHQGSKKARLDEEKAQKEREKRDVLANSILNHQTNSILQAGICDIHITVGKKERSAFAEAQDYLRATKQEHMTRVEGDLSGKKGLEVFLWIRTGQGDGVATSVTIQKAPLNHANGTVAKRRRQEALQSSHFLVGHDRCDLELMCKVVSRTHGTAPAVDDLVLCAKKADEGGLLQRGYERLMPQLKTVGLGKGFLFIHRKTHKTRPKALDVAKYRLKKSKWFTGRTALLVEKYALSEEDVIEIYRIFSRMDFKGDSTMDVYSFFSEMGEVETGYGQWLLQAVGAGGDKTDITWDQYLEAVCFFCMFSRHEVLRFVFGALDPKMRGYIDETDFQKFLTAVTQHQSGVPGNYAGKSKRAFEKLARSGTQLEFPQFEKLCAQYPRLPHPIYQLHTTTQKHNLGEVFWDTKKETFTAARRAVGVEKIR